MLAIKIGSTNASSNLNGGNVEFDLIQNEVLDIESKKYAVVVNGYCNEQEEEQILSKLKGKKIIFVATDSFCFERNAEIIKASEIVLHQGLQDIELECMKNKRQEFSNVPFIFSKLNYYKESRNKVAMVLFGGANTRRSKQFKEFIFNEDGSVKEHMFPIVKEYGEDGVALYDDRVPYEAFINLMGKFMFTLNISREEYTKFKWVTPRYIEAICSGCLPFIDDSYTSYFDDKKLYVSKYCDLVNKIKYYVENPLEAQKIIQERREEIICRRNLFKERIQEIIKE